MKKHRRNGTNTSAIDNEQLQLVEPQKHQQLVEPQKHQQLHVLDRESLCQEVTDRLGQARAIPLLFGVEIATGLTDNLIEKIVIKSQSLHSVSQLLSLGVTSIAQGKVILNTIFFCVLKFLCHSINH